MSKRITKSKSNRLKERERNKKEKENEIETKRGIKDSKSENEDILREKKRKNHYMRKKRI